MMEVKEIRFGDYYYTPVKKCKCRGCKNCTCK